MNEIQKYISKNESKMLEDLFSLIRIPSISAKPEHHDDMLACAERWAQLLIEAGADEALVMPSKGNPIVFGQKTVDPTAKTVLIYAHYDVMPAEPLELWKVNLLNRKYVMNTSGHAVRMMTKGKHSSK